MLREKLDLSSYLCLKWVTGIFIWQYDLTVGFCFQSHNLHPLESRNLASFSGLFEMWMLSHRGASSMSEMQFSVLFLNSWQDSNGSSSDKEALILWQAPLFSKCLFIFQNEVFQSAVSCSTKMYIIKKEKKTLFFPLTQFYEPNTYKYINKERERQQRIEAL